MNINKPKDWVVIGAVAATVAGGLWTAKYLFSRAANSAAAARLRELEQTWNKKQNVVIIHSISRAKTAPHASPFVIKMETYFRITGIPYELECEVPFGSKGKTPWATYNGESLTDSQHILEFMAKKFKITAGNYSKRERAIARTVRLMIEEHFYWGLGLWRYVYGDWQDLCKFFDMPASAVKELHKSISQRIITNAWAQGTGRHSKETVIETMNADLLALSVILGNKKFLLGNEPCEEDCSIFGFLVQILYCAPGSPYESYVKEELTNLVAYCDRIKELYWPDWDDCLPKQS